MNCEICQNPLIFNWTDTHGVGVCIRCGAPYRIYHYDSDSKRLDAPPRLALNESGVNIARRYWAQHKRMVFPGVYDIGFTRGSRTYSGASSDDIDAFNAWYKTDALSSIENARGE